MTDTERESIKVLRECVELQKKKKGDDYQSSASSVKQADHYRRGVDTIFDIMWGKMLRIRSLIESGRSDSAQFESAEDSFKDLINYASFAVSYIRGKMDGQEPGRDAFNKAVPVENFLIPKTDSSLSPLKSDTSADIVTKFINKFKDPSIMGTALHPHEQVIHEVKSVGGYGVPNTVSDDFILSNPGNNGKWEGTVREWVGPAPIDVKEAIGTISPPDLQVPETRMANALFDTINPEKDV